MLRRATTFPAPSLSLTTVGWLVAAAAWAAIAVSWAFGGADLMSHDRLVGEGHAPNLAALALFVGAWQLMTAAMMLPTSLPMVRLFARASRGQDRPRVALGLFLAAYFVVWTVFAIAALTGDSVLHGIVDAVPWLDEHPSVVRGSVLIGAGLFQFSSLKERCLDECRNALQFMWRHYRRGLGAAWSLGLRHAMFCLGCCWSLMLLMFAVGVGSIAWMVGITGVMLVEKTSPAGRRFVPIVGIALLILGGQAIAETVLAA